MLKMCTTLNISSFLWRLWCVRFGWGGEVLKQDWGKTHHSGKRHRASKVQPDYWLIPFKSTRPTSCVPLMFASSDAGNEFTHLWASSIHTMLTGEKIPAMPATIHRILLRTSKHSKLTPMCRIPSYATCSKEAQDKIGGGKTVARSWV